MKVTNPHMWTELEMLRGRLTRFPSPGMHKKVNLVLMQTSRPITTTPFTANDSRYTRDTRDTKWGSVPFLFAHVDVFLIK